ncbi:MAG: phosphoglycerate kinase [Deltaproteobacteria bacterium]|nr:phosphoglycerate kinase [Deltaproteobacteria bacterium]
MAGWGKIRSVADLPVEGQRVFVRVDFNVPLTPARGVADDGRIKAALPTIKHLIERGARVVLASHLGRPKGKPDPAFSMEPVAARLADLLKQDVLLTDEPVGDGARKVVSDLRAGQVALLENLRWSEGEEANDEQFARGLASYAQIYVNDAFGTAHRAHASTVGMIKYVTGGRGAGFLMIKEVEFLSRLLGEVERPFLAVVGGAKVSDKMAVLENLLGRVSAMLIGGAMANTFLKAQGKAVGKSRVEEDKLALARSFLRKAEERGVNVLLPRDVVVAPALDATSGHVVSVDAIPEGEMALDIGPDTARGFGDEIARARTLFWNGPMGLFESRPFAAGTQAVAQALAANTRCLSVVGGGDSAAAVEQLGLSDKITHISTGGGASLELIEGKELPGVKALEDDAPAPGSEQDGGAA